MALLQVDGLEIEVNEGRIIWCGPAEGTPDEGKALCVTWKHVPDGLRGAFLQLQQQCSDIVHTFMEENRPALKGLTTHVAALRAEGWDI